MSSIDKPKGEKYWKITFYIGGRRVRRSLRVESKTHAKKIQQRIDYELAMGTLDTNNIFANKNDKRSLDMLIQKFLDHLKNNENYSKNSLIAYRRAANLLHEITPGNFQVSQIDQRYISAHLLPALEKKFKPASVRHYVRCFSVIFGYGKKIGLLEKNPFYGQAPRVGKKMPVYFKDHEVNKICQYFYHSDRSAWKRLYFLTLLNTGNRREEHFNLCWSKNVFLDEGFIKFAGKGNKERLVPLNDESVSLFRAAERRLGSDRVFWQVENVDTVSKAWIEARKEIGIPYRLHNFRSNYASRFVMAGGSIYDLMQIMGWESYETAKIYLAFSPEYLERNKNRVRFDR